MLQAHAQSILDLLDADNTAPALVVLDGKVPTGTVAPYVLVYFRFARPGADAEPDKADLSFDQVSLRVVATAHSVGGTASAARAVAVRVAAALLNVTPSVASRSCFPVRWSDGRDAQHDETTGATVFDQVDVYEFTSVPA